jgi:hypothetical protein
MLACCCLSGAIAENVNTTMPVCAEGSFFASTNPGATCTSCSAFRSNAQLYSCDSQDHDHCCGDYGCGTYVVNAIGSTACFVRAFDKSVNVVAPTVIGSVLLLLLVASCCIKCSSDDEAEEGRDTMLQLGYFLTTLTQGLVLGVQTAYPIQLNADYSGVTATQDVLLTCVPALVLHALFGIVAVCLFCSKKKRAALAFDMAGSAAALGSVFVFMTLVRNPGGRVPLMDVDGVTVVRQLRLDPQYQAMGVLAFACMAHGLMLLTCAIKLLATCTCGWHIEVRSRAANNAALSYAPSLLAPVSSHPTHNPYVVLASAPAPIEV